MSSGMVGARWGGAEIGLENLWGRQKITKRPALVVGKNPNRKLYL